jgi:hypothetical protein
MIAKGAQEIQLSAPSASYLCALCVDLFRTGYGYSL